MPPLFRSNSGTADFGLFGERRLSSNTLKNSGSTHMSEVVCLSRIGWNPRTVGAWDNFRSHCGSARWVWSSNKIDCFCSVLLFFRREILSKALQCYRMVLVRYWKKWGFVFDTELSYPCRASGVESLDFPSHMLPLIRVSATEHMHYRKKRNLNITSCKIDKVECREVNIIKVKFYNYRPNVYPYVARRTL